MSWLAVLIVVLCYGTLVLSDAESDEQMTEEYNGMYMEAVQAMGMTGEELVADNPPETVGTGFQCTLQPEPPEPTSVHNLSPAHVDVVAAMGDSATAAYGARSASFIEIQLHNTEYRGISWSIGGEGISSNVMTLPNTIQYFNPHLTGFSTGDGNSYSPEAGLNVAVSGAHARDMLGQAETLVSRMEYKGITDEQWKVITIWIGGSDLCDIKAWDSSKYLADVYFDNMRRALNYLRDNVKRAFINVVQMIDITELNGISNFDCDSYHSFICYGITDYFARKVISTTAYRYNQWLEALIDDGARYDRDDFTVVLQPFFTNTLLPRLANRKADLSYFAPDCFHWNQLGHSVVATYLWNNMFEPVGGKTSQIDWNNLQPLKCPTNSPFFATYRNKNSGSSALIADSGSSVVDGGSSSSAFPMTSSLLQSAAIVAVVLSQVMS